MATRCYMMLHGEQREQHGNTLGIHVDTTPPRSPVGTDTKEETRRRLDGVGWQCTTCTTLDRQTVPCSTGAVSLLPAAPARPCQTCHITGFTLVWKEVLRDHSETTVQSLVLILHSPHSPECYNVRRVLRLSAVDKEGSVSVISLQELLCLRQRLDTSV